MNTVAEPLTTAEAGPLAREMAAGLRELVKSYKDEYGLSTPEAVARIREGLLDEEQDVLKCPPSAVMWYHLDALFERDPQMFLQRWEEIKRAAREELSTGHR